MFPDPSDATVYTTPVPQFSHSRTLETTVYLIPVVAEDPRELFRNVASAVVTDRLCLALAGRQGVGVGGHPVDGSTNDLTIVISRLSRVTFPVTGPGGCRSCLVELGGVRDTLRARPAKVEVFRSKNGK